MRRRRRLRRTLAANGPGFLVHANGTPRGRRQGHEGPGDPRAADARTAHIRQRRVRGSLHACTPGRPELSVRRRSYARGEVFDRLMPMQTRPREPLVSAVLRFGRALIVGSGATALDFAVLTTCIRILGVAPAHARLPALIAGASVQFFGHRTFT